MSRPYRCAPQIVGPLLAAALLGACGGSEAPSIAPRPAHPLNGTESVEALEAALADHPVVERHRAGFSTLWVAGPEGTDVTWQSGEAGWPIEVPYVEFLVRFPDRTHVVSDRWVANGELVVDGELHAGWGFVLTADHGLATFPFGNQLVDPVDTDGDGARVPPPPRWDEAVR